MMSVNLLPQSFFEGRRRKARIRMWSLFVVMHALLAGSVGAVLATSGESSTTIRARLSVAQSRLETREKETESARRLLSERMRRVEAVRSIADHPDWSLLLDQLAKLRGADVVLEHVDIKPQTTTDPGLKKGAPGRVRYQVTIEGLARTNAAVLEYALALQRLGAFDSVRPEQARQRATPAGDFFGFQLRCELGDLATQGAPR